MRLHELLSPLPSRIDELLNQPAAFTWKRQTPRSWEAKFEIGGAAYWVYLDGRDDEEVVLNFTDGQGSEEITGAGNAFQVFATVSTILKDFLGQRDPMCVTFSAKEASRAKLYSRMAQQLASTKGGEVVPFSSDRGQGFRVFLGEDGKIIPNVNTTVDVRPGETQRQAAKFGNTLDAQGRPPLLSGSYGDDSARFSANQGDPFYGDGGTRLAKNKKWT